MQAAPCGRGILVSKSEATRVVSSLVLPLPGAASTTQCPCTWNAFHCLGFCRRAAMASVSLLIMCQVVERGSDVGRRLQGVKRQTLGEAAFAARVLDLPHEILVCWGGAVPGIDPRLHLATAEFDERVVAGRDVGC